MVPTLPEASNFAPSLDRMFDAMLVLCGTVAVGVFAVMFWMCVKFRRGSNADRSAPPTNAMHIELLWTLVPFLLFVGIFGWSIDLWARLRSPPAYSLTLPDRWREMFLPVPDRGYRSRAVCVLRGSACFLFRRMKRDHGDGRYLCGRAT
nr:cytochrome c oxidase subunit II transmembrane domain-containing protein [Dyella acidiphila]